MISRVVWLRYAGGCTTKSLDGLFTRAGCRITDRSIAIPRRVLGLRGPGDSLVDVVKFEGGGRVQCYVSHIKHRHHAKYRVVGDVDVGRSIHRLRLWAFRGPPPPGKPRGGHKVEVEHLLPDGVRMNDIRNLEWCSGPEDVNNGVLQGLRAGERNSGHCLSLSAASAAYLMTKIMDEVPRCADQGLDIKKGALRKIMNGSSWCHDIDRCGIDRLLVWLDVHYTISIKRRHSLV